MLPNQPILFQATLFGDYGILKNAGSNTTYVTLEASFRTLSTLPLGSYKLKCTIGGLTPIMLVVTSVANPIINGTNETVRIVILNYFHMVNW